MNKANIFEPLQRAFDAKGYKNADIAYSVLDCSEATMSKSMNGKRPFTAEDMILIGEALGLSGADYYEYFVKPYRDMHRGDLYLED